MSTPIKDEEKKEGIPKKEIFNELEKATKDMPEKERLKLNTKVQKAIDQAEEVQKYLTVRMMMMKDIGSKSWKLLVISLLCIGISIFLDIKGMPTASLAFNGLWLIFFILHLMFENMKSKAQGQFDGAFEMLVILGHMDDSECDCDNCKPKGRKKKKAKSWFARPKEFFERMGKSKEAYGT